MSVRFSETLTMETLNRLSKHNLITEKYKTARPLMKFSASLHSAEAEGKFDTAQSGYMLRTETGSASDYVLQLRLDTLSLHKLSAYTEFNELRDELKSVWQVLLNCDVSPIIDQIAVRYVNVLAVSPTLEYVNLLPTNVLPHQKGNFFLQIDVKHETDPNLSGTIIETNQDGDSLQTNGLTLDIHVEKEIEASQRYETIWQDFDSLRAFKNDLFFAVITQKTQLLYQ